MHSICTFNARTVSLLCICPKWTLDYFFIFWFGKLDFFGLFCALWIKIRQNQFIPFILLTLGQNCLNIKTKNLNNMLFVAYVYSIIMLNAYSSKRCKFSTFRGFWPSSVCIPHQRHLKIAYSRWLTCTYYVYIMPGHYLFYSIMSEEKNTFFFVSKNHF